VWEHTVGGRGGRDRSAACVSAGRSGTEVCGGWNTAHEDAADRLEQEAWRRAVEGQEEPVVSMGKLVYGEDGKPIAPEEVFGHADAGFAAGRTSRRSTRAQATSSLMWRTGWRPAGGGAAAGSAEAKRI